MTKIKYWLSILAISVVLIAGSLAVSPIAIADDDDDDDDDDGDDTGAKTNPVSEAIDRLTAVMQSTATQGKQGPPGSDGAKGDKGDTGPPRSNDFSELTNVPGGLANGDQDALRTYNKNPPYGAPCDKLNSDISTVSYLMIDNAAITQLGFDSLIGNLPIFAEAQEPFIGEIIQFGGNFAPRGWAFAQGQLLPIAQNQALFSILGTQYGGDGRVTFALPDLRCLEPEGNTGPRYIIAIVGTFPSRN